MRAVLQNNIAATSSLGLSVTPPSTPSPPLTAAPSPSPVPGRALSYSPPGVGKPVVISGSGPISLVTPLGDNFNYHIPLPDKDGPFYIMTHGTDMGVFSGWENTQLLINEVSGCMYQAVASIDEGIARVESSLSHGKCTLLPIKKKFIPSPSVSCGWGRFRDPHGGPPGSASASAFCHTCMSLSNVP
ncbi:hypothetical protein ARMSODRAFT_1023791 [Armillaria solidipes]|uniref:Uncharacterized protein n=1 Tax=Armillaria solidipes TaxID=1076256 RepID=A0A2H3AY08_9AGAR|nr:hypothetical protein ARMSODRAFT_1023791 [Armillaria solidipes]